MHDLKRIGVSKIQNDRDYTSVNLGCVHNLGAGGVVYCKSIDPSNISIKRFCQWDHRTRRAVGLVAPS